MWLLIISEVVHCWIEPLLIRQQTVLLDIACVNVQCHTDT